MVTTVERLPQALFAQHVSTFPWEFQLLEEIAQQTECLLVPVIQISPPAPVLMLCSHSHLPILKMQLFSMERSKL